MTETVKMIKRELALRNISQADFSDMTGFEACTINRWMNDKREPRIGDVEKMAGALGLRIELM